MNLAVKPELGRREGGSKSFSSWALDTFPFKILTAGEICSGTQLGSTGKLAEREKKKKNKQKPGDMSKGMIQPQAGQKYGAVPK